MTNWKEIALCLCGDVMTGRGIDQVLSHPGNPTLHESCVRNALEYVQLAVRRSGPISWPRDDAWIWGEGLNVWKRSRPDLKVINLETAVTTSDDYDRAKEVHYRMHPGNVGCLTVADIDCCSLANNHVLDWGQDGLLETLDTLARAGIATAGAGRNLAEACRPAVFQVPGKGRVLVFGCGCESSGIPSEWAASNQRPGVWLVDEFSPTAAERIASVIHEFREPGDLVILSIHWGGNWGYRIPGAQRRLAHDLIDNAGCDVVHGHSSHHVKAIEIYRGRPVLFGCGDFLNDYEGITGIEQFRDDLGLMYFVMFDPAKRCLSSLNLSPTLIQHFRLNRPSQEDLDWLTQLVNREGRMFGTTVEQSPDGSLNVRWQATEPAASKGD